MFRAARALQWHGQRAFSPGPEGPGDLVRPCPDGDRSLRLSIFNEEFLVIASHQLALITSLPFVHTARRSYRSNGPVRSSDGGASASPREGGGGDPRSRSNLTV